MSILIGAGFVALNGRVPSDDEARGLAAEYAPAIERHALEVDRDDAQECLDHLLSYAGGRLSPRTLVSLPAGPAATPKQYFDDAERVVTMYGMRVKAEASASISLTAPRLWRTCSATPNGPGAWERALRKLPDAFTPPVPFNSGCWERSDAWAFPCHTCQRIPFRSIQVTY